MNAELLQTIENEGRTLAKALFTTGLVAEYDVHTMCLARIGWLRQSIQKPEFWRCYTKQTTDDAVARNAAFMAGVSAEIEEQTK